MENMICHTGCAACCIAPSLSSVIPGMPEGKPAGVPCIQLTEDKRCKVYGKAERPAVCSSYRAVQEFCGSNEGDALRILEGLEMMTCSDRRGEKGE